METVLDYRPRRHHRADNSDYCLVEGVKVAAVFCRQLGGDAGVVIGIPTKEDHLRHLSGQVIIGLTQLCRLGLRGVELFLDGQKR
jgi:hypothetical protein